MISYQELVASLTEWRVRQGLPTGHTDYLGEPMPMPLVGPPQPEADAVPAEEYAELADSEILSEEPDEAVSYGEIGGAGAYPGEEPVSFPDTDAVSMDEAGTYGEAAPAADQWGGAPPAADGWDQAPAEYGSYEDQPAAGSWDEAPAPVYDGAQQDAAGWDVAPPAADAQAGGAYEGENEVTEFAPPPEHDDDREYADVMEEPAQSDLSAQTWDTEAEAEAVSAGSGGLYEEDPYAMAGVEPPPLEGAQEGESTMDVDPDEILSADDLADPIATSGEIGGDDPFAEPPPLAPPPEGDPAAGAGYAYDEAAVDPSGKPDPDQQ